MVEATPVPTPTPTPGVIPSRKPHLKATNNQQGVDIVGAEILHNGLQVGLGQCPVVRDTLAWLRRCTTHKTRVHLLLEKRGARSSAEPEVSHQRASQRLQVEQRYGYRHVRGLGMYSTTSLGIV